MTTRPQLIALSRLFALLTVAVLAALLLVLYNRDDKSRPASYRVGAIMANPGFASIWDAFEQEMTQQGFVVGRNITYFNEPTLELLAQDVSVEDLDLLVVLGGTFGLPGNALLQVEDWAQGKTPIVVVPGSGDPVKSGDAVRLQRPGKNITGILLLSVDNKRFELFITLLPDDADNIAIIYDSQNTEAVEALAQIQELARRRALDLTLLDTPSSAPEKTEAALAHLPDDVDGIFMLKVWGPALRWFQLGFERKIPTSMDGIGSGPEFPQPLMAYGPSLPEIGQQAAGLARNILHGSTVGDVPMQYAGAYLTIDLGVANAIGLVVPNSALAQAAFVNHTDPSVFALPPTSVPSAVTQAAGTGACTASLASPGGINSICVTTSCDNLVSGSFIKYSDQQDVASCSTQGVVGICVTSAFDTYYYDGEVATLKIGCGFSAGQWTTP